MVSSQESSLIHYFGVWVVWVVWVFSRRADGVLISCSEPKSYDHGRSHFCNAAGTNIISTPYLIRSVDTNTKKGGVGRGGGRGGRRAGGGGGEREGWAGSVLISCIAESYDHGPSHFYYDKTNIVYAIDAIFKKKRWYRNRRLLASLFARQAPRCSTPLCVHRDVLRIIPCATKALSAKRDTNPYNQVCIISFFLFAHAFKSIWSPFIPINY